MPTAKNFFNEREQQMLIQAIVEAEMKTSGEIRLHLENFCWGDEVKAAKKVFKKLGMHQTKEKNGVLIYIATLSHKIAIVGDEGIHQKLGNEYWQKMVNDLIARFKENKQADALAECIRDCGAQLGKFFPLSADDKNELSNSISF
ncbi:MAG: TPM domain-containing protein [Bacteroidia bacterium]|nr:TPM domain-containing protein [Bacteroidia bacterium]